MRALFELGWHGRAAPWLGVIALLGGTTAARAFCNSTNCRDSACVPPQAVCDFEEQNLVWPEADILYAFSQRPDGRLEADLSEAEIRHLTDQSFAQWEAAWCTGGKPGLRFVEDARTTDLRLSDFTDDRNTISFLTAQEWDRYPCPSGEPGTVCPLGDDAFALTDVFFEEATGEVHGFDMLVSGKRGPYRECPPPNGCSRGTATDLRNVLTHEIGHVLGFGHSPEPAATMFARADEGEILKRDLHPDDIKGVCSLYPPGSLRPGGGDSCSSGATPQKGFGWAGAALLGAASVMGLRRRRRPA